MNFLHLYMECSTRELCTFLLLLNETTITYGKLPAASGDGGDGDESTVRHTLQANY